ncbi:uncharacterized protein LOC121386926 [Gigantopelta aegis]|uniref:uncharacterized protein LOC121386926 n=1 Tax=Gigantopelta aegis TaxID=1735272 RepID=UPI001B88BDF3|nr:uncharacterized protein LOC121386926 [Gigantopelta aegis]
MSYKQLKVTMRLSPNEVERLVKEETQKRRKTRILQVREQCKANAAKIRKDVRLEKERLLVKMAHDIEKQLEEEKREKVRHLEQEYENTLKSIGSAHRTARQKSESIQSKLRKQNAEKQIAANRGKVAMKKEMLEKAKQNFKENRHIISRQTALEAERLRAAGVASLPPPPPDPIDDVLHKQAKRVALTDTNAFTTTHYHIPECSVVRAGPEEQTDGKSAGEEESERMKQMIYEKKRALGEAFVRARIRGQEALKKEQLKHDYEAMLEDLSFMQRADRKRRQDIVADLPKQVFIPPNLRIEEKVEKQRDMEQAFENIYLTGRELADGIEMTLDPDQLPDTPCSVNSFESSQLTTNAESKSRILDSSGNATQDEGETTQNKKQETVLKNLLDKIKKQKAEHTKKIAVEMDLPDKKPQQTESSRHTFEEALEHHDQVDSGEQRVTLEQRVGERAVENDQLAASTKPAEVLGRHSNSGVSPLSEYSMPDRNETLNDQDSNSLKIPGSRCQPGSGDLHPTSNGYLHARERSSLHVVQQNTETRNQSPSQETGYYSMRSLARSQPLPTSTRHLSPSSHLRALHSAVPADRSLPPPSLAADRYQPPSSVAPAPASQHLPQTSLGTVPAADQYLPQTSLETVSAADQYLPQTSLGTVSAADRYLPQTSLASVPAMNRYLPQNSLGTVPAMNRYLPKNSLASVSAMDRYLPQSALAAAMRNQYLPPSSLANVSATDPYLPQTSLSTMSATERYLPFSGKTSLVSSLNRLPLGSDARRIQMEKVRQYQQKVLNKSGLQTSRSSGVGDQRYIDVHEAVHGSESRPEGSAVDRVSGCRHGELSASDHGMGSRPTVSAVDHVSDYRHGESSVADHGMGSRHTVSAVDHVSDYRHGESSVADHGMGSRPTVSAVDHVSDYRHGESSVADHGMGSRPTVSAVDHVSDYRHGESSVADHGMGSRPTVSAVDHVSDYRHGESSVADHGMGSRPTVSAVDHVSDYRHGESSAADHGMESGPALNVVDHGLDYGIRKEMTAVERVKRVREYQQRLNDQYEEKSTLMQSDRLRIQRQAEDILKESRDLLRRYPLAKAGTEESRDLLRRYPLATVGTEENGDLLRRYSLTMVGTGENSSDEFLSLPQSLSPNKFTSAAGAELMTDVNKSSLSRRSHMSDGNANTSDDWYRPRSVDLKDLPMTDSLSQQTSLQGAGDGLAAVSSGMVYNPATMMCSTTGIPHTTVNSRPPIDSTAHTTVTGMSYVPPASVGTLPFRTASTNDR